MFKLGDKVKWTKAFRKRMFWEKIQYGNNTESKFFSRRNHLKEFKNCIGEIVGIEEEFVRVFWLGKNLKYTYYHNELELVK